MAERPRAANTSSALSAHDAANRRLIAGTALALEAVAAKPTRMKPQPGDLLAHCGRLAPADRDLAVRLR